jgi:2-iminobutanoate/2-iminopropanoate deaminase
MRLVIATDKAPKPIGVYSQAIKAGNFIFVSGQIAIDPETGNFCGGDAREQTRLIFKNIEAILTAGGSSLQETIKLTVFLTDLADFGSINEVFKEFFIDPPPAREVVEVSRLPKDAKIEISAIAYIGTSEKE